MFVLLGKIDDMGAGCVKKHPSEPDKHFTVWVDNRSSGKIQAKIIEERKFMFNIKFNYILQ